MINIQQLLDVMSEQDRQQRTNYHLTLGQLIDKLQSFDQYGVVFHDETQPHEYLFDSYRGYYSDLAMTYEPSKSHQQVNDLLFQANLALNNTYEGYKGGDYVMTADTPLWLANWGETSDIAIVDVCEIGIQYVKLITKQLED